MNGGGISELYTTFRKQAGPLPSYICCKGRGGGTKVGRNEEESNFEGTDLFSDAISTTLSPIPNQLSATGRVGWRKEASVVGGGRIIHAVLTPIINNIKSYVTEIC